MDKFVVKRPRKAGLHDSGCATKRARKLEWGTRVPLSIIAWNCNGLPVRLRTPRDADALREFVDSRQPDVFCISEVRIGAHCRSPSAKRGDGMLRSRGKMACADKSQVEDKRIVEAFLSLSALENYKAYYSLSDYKYAGTAILLNSAALSEPTSIRYNLDLDAPAERHSVEGRVIYMEWPSLALLHTYVPNNGWTDKGFERRKEWDESIKEFLSSRRTAGVDVVWCGDLNVSPTDADLSHPAYYRKQVAPNAPRPLPIHVGQPGCTDAERQGLADILSAGALVDLFRELTPSDQAVDLGEPIFSWRGGNPGKHYGRGMRIDHFFGPSAVAKRLDSVTICGRGVERDGFLGSDHSPIALCLRQAGEPMQSEFRDDA
jgi:exodeoxyribonuclease III